MRRAIAFDPLGYPVALTHVNLSWRTNPMLDPARHESGVRGNMLRNTVLVGLLILPGAFLILGLACLHPLHRKKIVRLSELSRPLAKAGHAFGGILAKLPAASRSSTRGVTKPTALNGLG